MCGNPRRKICTASLDNAPLIDGFVLHFSHTANSILYACTDYCSGFVRRFLTNHSARTACSSNPILGKPAGPVNRRDFASPYDPPFPHDLHDPQIGQFGFRVSTNTPTARRPSAWAARGLAFHTALPKTVQTIPTYIVYDNIAGILRGSEEPGLFWMA